MVSSTYRINEFSMRCRPPGGAVAQTRPWRETELPDQKRHCRGPNRPGIRSGQQIQLEGRKCNLRLSNDPYQPLPASVLPRRRVPISTNAPDGHSHASQTPATTSNRSLSQLLYCIPPSNQMGVLHTPKQPFQHFAVTWLEPPSLSLKKAWTSKHNRDCDLSAPSSNMESHVSTSIADKSAKPRAKPAFVSRQAREAAHSLLSATDCGVVP